MKSKIIRWLHEEIKTPPLSIEARREIGFLLRMVQEGEKLSMPHAALCQVSETVVTGCE